MHTPSVLTFIHEIHSSWMPTQPFLVCDCYPSLINDVMKASNKQCHCGSTPSNWGQLVVETLANYSFMFLRALHKNLEKEMLVWSQFELASGLHINWRKSSLISCIVKDLPECLGRQGSVVRKGSIPRDMGKIWRLMLYALQYIYCR